MKNRGFLFNDRLKLAYTNNAYLLNYLKHLRLVKNQKLN